MPYTSITIEGGMFPPDLLDRIAAGELDGQKAADFGLDRNDRLSDEIQSAFSDVRAYWDAFQRRAGHSSDRITSLTREFWMMPVLETLGFSGTLGLTYQQAAVEAGGDTFVISHRAGQDQFAPPVHIAALGQDLGKKPDRARRSPHATVQEFLNRTDALWGIVTNGEKLRLLRNSVRISRPTYLEFDLRGMIEGNLYSEFAVLYRLLHRSRFPHGSADAAECQLERYYTEGIEQGGRVQEDLRLGVERALEKLGTAFLSHPDNHELRDNVAAGRPDADDYYRELLRLIYRTLFLFVAEERGLLFAPDDSLPSPSIGREPVPSLPREAGGEGRSGSDGLSDIYTRYYSLSRLRNRCDRPFRGDRYIDLWTGLVQTFRLFRYTDHAEQLGLTALNGELFGNDACKNLEVAVCANEDLLDALFHLSTFYDRDGKVRRRVNYAGLDVEELGSVYESLLDYKPAITLEAPARFHLTAGGERKSTGSYYTPPSLVAELIESALVPVINEKLSVGADPVSARGQAGSTGGHRALPYQRADGSASASHLSPTDLAKRSALLSMRVIDPASGSGHFLLAAARRIAREVARIDSGEPEPPPETYRHALREVIRQCIYAVDKNPLAVDLCKVALWLEGHEPGKPLSFLDHHIKHGDSLIGVMDLQVLEDGIPNDAYKRDDKSEHKAGDPIRKRNQAELKGQRSMFEGAVSVTDGTGEIAAEMDRLRYQRQASPQDVEAITHAYQRIRREGTDWRRLKIAADLWTSAFFGNLSDGADAPVPTTDTVRRALNGEKIDDGTFYASMELAETVPYFHWPLEFLDVFESGGFDIVLGNPPWDQIQLDPREFFAGHVPEIAEARNASQRTKLINDLETNNPHLYARYTEAEHAMQGVQRFIHVSGRFPLTSYGRLNLAPLFTESARNIISQSGRSGVLVPTGIATDSFNQYFFRDIVESRQLLSFFDHINTHGIFPTIDRNSHFSLLTITGHATDVSWFAFFLHDPNQLRDPERSFVLTRDDLRLLNPNTRTCPIFATRRDAQITKEIYERVPILLHDEVSQVENPWGFRVQLMFMMNSDSNLFLTRDDLEEAGLYLDGNVFVSSSGRFLPLYEGKMINQFDHRYASATAAQSGQRIRGGSVTTSESEHIDPAHYSQPRYWVSESDVESRTSGDNWSLSYREVAGAVANVRTVVAAMIPRSAVGHKAPLIRLERADSTGYGCLLANLNSFVLDYQARQKISGVSLSLFILKQLPVLPPDSYLLPSPWDLAAILRTWIVERSVELTYTAWDMQPFARDCGYDGPPFRWDEERRFLLRCELDAAFFHLYGIERDDVDYIMETFRIVRERDEKAHGEYRTKRVILEIYDAMSHAITTGAPYQTRLDPPPADPRVAHAAPASARGEASVHRREG